MLIVPALFGSGKPLAQDPRGRHALELASHEVYPDGAVDLTCRFR